MLEILGEYRDEFLIILEQEMTKADKTYRNHKEKNCFSRLTNKN